MWKTLLFWTFIPDLLYGIVGGHTCEYRIPELISGIEIKPLPSNFREKRATTSNLRIYYDYQESFLRNRTQTDILKTTILEPARDKLQLLLQVKAPTNGILLVNRACPGGLYRRNQDGVIGCVYPCMQTICLNAVVPEKYLKKCVTVDVEGKVHYKYTDGSGITNYDIVLLITYTPCDGGTLASAASCFTESTLDRPILGTLNLCYDKMKPYLRIKENIKIVMHEIIHALGIAVDKYAFYRYSDGTPIVPRNIFGLPSLGVSSTGYYLWNEAIIKTVVRPRASINLEYTVSFYGFVLPNVLKAAREHFNCPTLDAVDLENYGGVLDGSAMSHFDEYFLYNELMTPVTNNGMDFLSKITLALLQDTGWYIADLNGVGNLDYGYRKGCLLPEKGCYTYMQNKKSKNSSLDPFCNEPFHFGKVLSCSRFNDYFAYCSLYKFKSVPNYNQYFTNLTGVAYADVKTYSGPSPYNEYCPSFEMQFDYSSVCADETNITSNGSGYIVPSYFKPDSVCVPTDISNNVPNTTYGASCQKFTGKLTSGSFTVYIGNLYLNCPSTDILNYSFETINATFRCPKIENQSYSEPTTDSNISTFISLTTTTKVSQTIFNQMGIFTKVKSFYQVLIIMFLFRLVYQ